MLICYMVNIGRRFWDAFSSRFPPEGVRRGIVVCHIGPLRLSATGAWIWLYNHDVRCIGRSSINYWGGLLSKPHPDLRYFEARLWPVPRVPSTSLKVPVQFCLPK